MTADVPSDGFDCGGTGYAGAHRMPEPSDETVRRHADRGPRVDRGGGERSGSAHRPPYDPDAALSDPESADYA